MGSGPTSEGLTLISGVVLNCGGPLSRVPAALASLKLGVGELGGFTGSGTKRLGPPELFPEPEAALPAPVGAAVLDSFLGKEWRQLRLRSLQEDGHKTWAPKGDSWSRREQNQYLESSSVQQRRCVGNTGF